MNLRSTILSAITIFLCQFGQAQIDTVFAKSPLFRGDYFSNSNPNKDPLVFAQGLIDPKIHHFHSAPVFSRDMTEMYFSVYLNNDFPQRIFVSKKTNGIWRNPELAPFSGQYQDGSPIFSPDGETLFFYSKRPDKGGDDELANARIWFVERTLNSWSKPQVIHFKKSLGAAFYPDHYASNGIFYFSVKVAARDYDIYECRLSRNKPKNIKRLDEPISIKGKIENGVITNSDNTILIFQSYDRNDQKKLSLHASRKLHNGDWGEPVVLPEKINKGDARFASFSQDGRYFFFTSYRSGVEEIYWLKSAHLFDQSGDR